MNFKNFTEDQDSPVPEEVRDSLLVFHMDLLAHCGQSFIPLAPLFLSCLLSNASAIAANNNQDIQSLAFQKLGLVLAIC